MIFIKNAHPYILLIGKIAEYKKIHGLTNKDLADKAGLSLASYDAFVCGARVTEKNAKAISRAIGLE